MFRTLSAIIASMRESRSRKRMVQQFTQQGFTQAVPPAVPDWLPLLYPQLIRPNSVFLFEKADTQVLLFSTTQTPRTRNPRTGRSFLLMVLPLGDEPQVRSISAALREPSELCSIVDLLNLDSYPSISPLPDGIVFAADLTSAQRLLSVQDQHRNLKKQGGRGSLVLHNGRMLLQMAM